MQATTVHTLDPLSDPRWDALSSRHPRASIFHQRAWLKALLRTYGYKPVVFTTSSPSSELENGLLFCQVNSWLTGRRLVSLPFSDHCEPLCDSTEEMRTLVRHTQIAVNDREWKYLELRPTDEQFGEASKEIGLQPIGCYFHHVLDLTPPLDDLLRGFDKDSVRRRIKRAEQAGLVEKCGNSRELLEEFYSLFILTRGRHHLPPPPFAWFQNLADTQGQALEIRVAYKDSVPIAALLTLRFREIAYFKYGCSNSAFKQFGATPWLLWRAIAAAKNAGARQFDLGRTDHDNAGLLAFKNNWVSAYKKLLYWRFPGAAAVDISEGWKLKMAKRLFSHMPHPLLVISGKLVYRHIG
jgi:Acetyltransferase (GNAT) domain